MTSVRNRANSVGNIKELINKRKRQEQDNSTTEKESEAVKKSRKVQRSQSLTKISPENQSEEETMDLERLEKLIMGLSSQMQEIKVDTSGTKVAIEGIHEQMKKYGEEIRGIKEDLLKKEVEWDSERAELRKEIDLMKRKLEIQERNSKKNNIIIKGKSFSNENIKHEVKEFLRQEINVTTDIEEAFMVGRREAKMTIVKLKSFDQKLKVLQQKRNLGDNEIYIDCDLTMDEQKIQAAIRKVAREEKGKGKKTKVGYRKIIINNTKYEWSEAEGGSLKKVVDQDPK